MHVCVDVGVNEWGWTRMGVRASMQHGGMFVGGGCGGDGDGDGDDGETTGWRQYRKTM